MISFIDVDIDSRINSFEQRIQATINNAMRDLELNIARIMAEIQHLKQESEPYVR